MANSGLAYLCNIVELDRDIQLPFTFDERFRFNKTPLDKIELHDKAYIQDNRHSYVKCYRQKWVKQADTGTGGA